MADEALSDVSCKRLVIDVSGDGRSNEGREPKSVHARLAERGAVVNALVIENEGDDLTGYFLGERDHGRRCLCGHGQRF